MPKAQNTKPSFKPIIDLFKPLTALTTLMLELLGDPGWYARSVEELLQ